MLKKMLLAGLFALVFSTGAFAGDFVALTFNYYADGEIIPDGDLPAGLTWNKVRFSNKKLPGHAFGVILDLAKTPTFKHSFTIQGGGRLVISVNPYSMVDGQRTSARVKCVKMVVKGASEHKGKPYPIPFVFNKWRYACPEMMVKDGDTITIEATFVKLK